MAPASPALYPEEDGSWGLGAAAAAGLGAGSSGHDCMRFTDADARQRDVSGRPRRMSMPHWSPQAHKAPSARAAGVWQPWSFEYAVHEVYGRRSRRPAEGEKEKGGGGGVGSWEMWHHPHDLLIMPRTLSRLQQLKDKWAAGNRVGEEAQLPPQGPMVVPWCLTAVLPSLWSMC